MFDIGNRGPAGGHHGGFERQNDGYSNHNRDSGLRRYPIIGMNLSQRGDVNLQTDTVTRGRIEACAMKHVSVRRRSRVTRMLEWGKSK